MKMGKGPGKRSARQILWMVPIGLICATSGVRADWGQLGGNAARTGYVNATLSVSPQLLWSFNFTPNDVFSTLTEPVAGNGRLFLSKSVYNASGGADARGYNLFTGEQLWHTSMPANGSDKEASGATYANNKVYVHKYGNISSIPSEAADIYSFDPRTGARTLVAQHQGEGFDTTVTVNDDFIFSVDGDFGGAGGWGVRAGAPWSRTEIDWADTFMGDLNFDRYPTAANDHAVYLFRDYDQGAGSPYSRLVGLNERTGATVLDYRIEGALHRGWPNRGNRSGGLVLGSQNNALVNFRHGTTDYVASISLSGAGSEQWRVPVHTNSSYVRSVAQGNGIVYAQTDIDTIVALDEIDGSLLWEWSLPKGSSYDRLTRAMVVTDSHVLVTGGGTYNPSVHAIDIANGQGSIYLPLHSLHGISDGILLTNGPGSFNGGQLYGHRISNRVTTHLVPLVDGRLRLTSATPSTAGNDAAPVVQNNTTHDDGLMEFDLGGLPADARIRSATLMLETWLLGGALDEAGGIEIYGYVGNGTLDVPDATGALTLLARPDNVTNLGSLAIDLETDFLQSLMAPGAVLGLRINTWGTLHQYGFNALESDSPSPRLSIHYTVPLLGDFNDDILVTATDLDLLGDAIEHGGDLNLFDINEDGVVSLADLSHHLAEILRTTLGDADLDRDVDLNDLSALASAYGGSNNGWSNGDFDLDGDVDLNDLSALATHYNGGMQQAMSDFAVLVPEPATGGILMGLGILGMHRFIGRRKISP